MSLHRHMSILVLNPPQIMRLPSNGMFFGSIILARRGSFITFAMQRSRAARDRCMAKVMKDPRLAKMMDPKNMPFDGKRMIWGGFKTRIDM